jgi:GH24 family phage-related lysozyme (muramidase)
MTPSNKAIILIKQFEGCRLQAYQDQKGVWTVGFGCTGYGIGPTTVWTQEEAEQALMTRLEAIGRLIQAKVVPILGQSQLDALCSLIYNIGMQAFTGSTLLRCLNKRDFKGASNQFLAWDHIGGTVSEGLLRRREAEKTLFMSS